MKTDGVFEPVEGERRKGEERKRIGDALEEGPSLVEMDESLEIFKKRREEVRGRNEKPMLARTFAKSNLNEVKYY